MKSPGLLLIPLMAFFPFGLNACELNMRVSNFAPLSYQTADKTWAGLDVELAAALAEQIGCELRFTDIPWKRALLSLLQGEVDLMANLSKTTERSSYLYFVGPERDETIVIAVPSAFNATISRLDDIKHIDGRIGIQSGSFYGREFESKFRDDVMFAAKFDALSDDAGNLKKLHRKRIVGFFADYYQISDKIRHSPEHKQLKIHPFIVNSDQVYFGFSKKSVEVSIVQKAEAAMLNEELKSKFAIIIARYRAL